MENRAVPVVAAIIEKEGKILAARRRAASTNALMWEFPGGKVDVNEAEVEALIREIKEELGVSVAAGRRLSPVKHTYPWISIELVAYVCTITAGTPHPHEHEQIAWYSPAELQDLHWAPADIPILREYLKMLGM